SGWSADARDLAGHAGAVRADIGRTFSSQRKESFFRREGTGAVLTSKTVSDWPLHIRIRMLVTRLLKAVGPGYVRAHTHAARHRNEIERTERCGCFYCLET